MSNGQQGFLPSLKLGPREAPKQQTARAAISSSAKTEPAVRLSLPATPQSARVQKPVERLAETRAEEAADDLDAGHFNISTSTVASCPALQITAPLGCSFLVGPLALFQDPVETSQGKSGARLQHG